MAATADPSDVTLIEQASLDVLIAILQWVDWRTQQTFFSLSRRLRAIGECDEMWRWRLQRLQSQDNVYISHNQALPPREVFLQHWPLRLRWDIVPGAVPTTQTPQAAIRVCARFRPLSAYGEPAEVEHDTVVVPLHQRLRMIQQHHKCDAKEARRLLWGGVVGAEVDPFAGAAVKENGADKGGPTAGTGKAAEQQTPSDAPSALPTSVHTGVLAVRPEQRNLVLCAPGAGVRSFQFDAVLDDASSQEAVYDAAGRHVVREFVNGVNGLIMAYGQTGSGKTFTMFGPDGEAATRLTQLAPIAGIAPRAVAEVLAATTRRSRQCRGLETRLSMTVVEVFGDKITDLLADAPRELGNWRGVAARALAEDAAAVDICSWTQAEELLARAETNKRRAATAMNERSSRAHTLLMLTLTQKVVKTGLVLRSILGIADLGGSEQVKKSMATGERLQEAVQINMGLLSLKVVMTHLAQKKEFVGFAGSALTGALRPLLQGNSVVSAVVCGSLDKRYVNETLDAMNFGKTMSGIKYDVETNMRPAADMVVGVLNKEIEELEERIRNTERWENRRVTREDVYGVVETMLISVPAGAEDLRARYEELLETRRQLVGLI